MPTPDALDIGEYTGAVYHQEGLFSVIYKAPAAKNDGYFPANTSSNKKLVALKVTTPSMMEPPHDSRREARILERATSPHVIPLLEAFREAGTRFVLVFPYMSYEFGDALQRDKLSKQQIQSALKGMFSALAFIHERGIIHRDVKPSNILLKSLDGPAYLADFGIAWAPSTVGSEEADSRITDVGTTCYRPPELLFGNKSYGCSLDMWAAGCTFAEAVRPKHSTLFDSGELGSDLALIQSMFSKLGTPNLTVWPVRYPQHWNTEPKLMCNRRPQTFPTGAKCSFTNILRSRGQTFYLVLRRMSGTLLARWFDMRAARG